MQEKSTTKFIKYAEARSIMRRITVGIPAYNEERNMINLLRSLEGQGPLISEVVISDDSSDRTAARVSDFAQRSSLDIILFHHETRRGAAEAWNEIFHHATGDVVVLYDADTIPHPSCTEKLASSILENIALCASNSHPVEAAGVAGRASVFISNWLRSVRRLRLSQYTVMGRALAIDAEAARRIQIPSDTIAIDLYLQCKILEMGLEVAYNDDAIVYFKPPESMQDMASQVMRAVNGHNQIKNQMSPLDISLPPHLAFAQTIKNATMDPRGAISTMIGCALMPYYKSRLRHTDSAKWHTANSSKAIDYQQLKAKF